MDSDTDDGFSLKQRQQWGIKRERERERERGGAGRRRKEGVRETIASNRQVSNETWRICRDLPLSVKDNAEFCMTSRNTDRFGEDKLPGHG